jgi:very-short-patch-repair endonuclease
VARALLTEDQLRSSAWRRLYRGVYADASLPDTPGTRIAGAALLLPSTGAFSQRTAAYLLGAAEVLDRASPLDVSVPRGVSFGPVAGLRVHQAVLPDEDVRTVRGLRCTVALRTALDIARWEPAIEAVCALDVLAGRHLVPAASVVTAAEALPVGPGSRRALVAARLVDGRSGSPQESRLRVVLGRAGLPAVPQFTVRAADGTFVARVDLAYPAHRVAVEYDGAVHAGVAQMRRDRRRSNALLAAGWVVLHVTVADLRDPALLARRVRDLLAARRFPEVGA